MGIFPKIFTWGNRRPRRLCFAVGLYTIGYGIYDMSWAAFTHNTRDPLPLKSRYGEGTWVVLSGATHPTSIEFAKVFSKKGFNLVLVDEDQAKLDEVRQNILGLSEETKIEMFPFDFQNNDEWQQYQTLCSSIQEKVGGKENISILVNNVEMRDPHGKKIHKSTDKELLQTLNKNTFPIVFMSRFLGPDLKQRVKGKTHSAIINMTSSFADYPNYSLPVFSASKSFSDVLSQNLWYEN